MAEMRPDEPMRGMMRPARARTVGAGALIACVALMAAATWLKPDPRGFGTHTQLTHGPCVFHWLTGVPCPTCGMTTSFAHMARLQVLRAAKVQPFGAILFVVAVALIPVSVLCIAAGRMPRVRIHPNWIAIPALILLLAGWACKIIVSL